jgi:hypothetical protein
MAQHFESIHLPHFLDAGADAPVRIRRLAAHYGDLVRVASHVDAGVARRTPIRCRRRPRHRACDGLLVVAREEATSQVDWHCPVCGASGVITGWQATASDLRAMRCPPREEMREVAVGVEALAALREVARSDPELGRLAFCAEVDEQGHPLLLVRDDARTGYASRLAVEAMNSASGRARALLMSLVDALAESTSERADGVQTLPLDPAVAHELLRHLFEGQDTAPPRFVFAGEGRPSARTRRRRRGAGRTFQIKVTLRDVRPPIWRRLLVPSDILLPDLHDVLQVAMGWNDAHLHLFRVRDDCYAPPGDWASVGEDSRGVALSDLAPNKGARLVYEYDFGDGWTHDILVESVSPEPCAAVHCIAGRRRCPPEDCGGPWGYAELLSAMRDPSHERHQDVVEWCGEAIDPEEFDLANVNVGLRTLGRW